MGRNQTTILEDPKVSIKVKLSALWAAVMLCYSYGDILGFFMPGLVSEIQQGNMGFLGPATQGKMLSGAIMMSIPCIMVFLSLVLKPVINRWVNVFLGILYTLIMLATLFTDPWYYYLYFGLIEIIFTLAITWTAWRWPVVSLSTSNI